MPAATKGIRAMLPLLWILSLAGCAGVLPKPPEPPPRTYLLAPALAAEQARPGGGHPRDLAAAPATLSVSRPDAAAGYSSARMAYMERDYQLDYFADHAWVDPPASLLTPLLVEALGASGSFGAVTEEVRGVGADLRLDTLILDLYQDFRMRPSRTRVGLQVRLVDQRSGRILGYRRFDASEPAPSDDPYGGVVAANRALARLLPQIVQFAVETARGSEGMARDRPAGGRG